MRGLHILQILPMYHTDGEELLNDLAHVTKFNEFNEQEIIEFLKNNAVDGIILRAPAKITSAILDACQDSIVISGAGVGLDNIDVAYATKKGIRVLHAPKINSQATAEHAASLILATMKNIPMFHKETKQGNFGYRDGKYTRELYNKKMGLIGFGSIAQKVAKIMRYGFDMEVIVYVRNIYEERKKLADSIDVKLTTSMKEVFRESDVISLHIPLNDHTKELIDRTYFDVMKYSAVLINTARGGIINENDLVEALRNRKILRAGIDVFSNEPPPVGHPFFDLEEIILTPHIGGISLEAAKATSVTIVENLVKAINGEELETIVNGDQINAKEREERLNERRTQKGHSCF
ncbi:hydroxyacid dehydrogenase [Halobacillus shinanisalinarum]|uniref:Hydroxyacid dehydrogenase n=1 Tax=Halobacillus shinanisalinarum TaxID=2932258 RepID=A0ABY4GY79_9BACI|nr:hydroxyacid dehydrogenase [Halobacillus shinanisalinarum]UOQ93162.1 hydroxyacid dehydrogenase [Halobacillus shinanisalinarum]